MPLPWLVCLIFFLSGAAALIFETLWFRQAGLALGNTVWASSVVLASFMGGLALGNALSARYGLRIQRPLLVYAKLEGVIAVVGLVLTAALPLLGSVLAPLFGALGEGWGVGAVRLLVAFVCLLAPATAMGATLPVLTKALFARDARFGKVLGTLYGWNTLGAVAGALAGELLLVEHLGVYGAGLVACGLGLTAGAGALWLSRRAASARADAAPAESEATAAASEATAPASEATAAASEATATPSEATAPLTSRARRLLVAAFVCGLSLLALEVVWFRFLLLFATATAAIFSAMLATVLAGIAAGGLLGSFWLRTTPGAPRALTVLAFGAGIVAAGAYAFFDPFAVSRFGYTSSAGDMIQVSAMLMLPVCVFSGVLFTLQGEALHAEIGGAPGAETRAAGLLTLANTVGGIVGSILGGFVFLPWLGVEHALFALAASYGVAALFLWEPPEGNQLRRVSLIGGAICFFAVLFAFPFGRIDQHLAVSGRGYMKFDNARTVAFDEGLNCTVRCLQTDFLGEPLHHRLLTNGYSMSGSQVSSRRYMKLYVYLPAAVQPRLESALLIGFGVGQTAKALVDTRSLEEIHVADPAPEILAMSPVIYPRPGDDPLRDPRVKVHVEDGRFFLQTTKKRFDLITGEPPPPKNAGIVNLYTKDFFQLLHDRLNEGGMVTYWLPGHSLSEADAQGIVRAFLDVFDDATLWQGWGLNLMLVGTRGGAERAPVSLEQFSAPWRDRRVASELATLGFERPEQLGALFLADAPMLRERLKGVEPLTDEQPYRLSAEVLTPDVTWRELSPWLDVEPARARFAESPWIAARWPAELREASLPWFDAQARINRVPTLIGGRAALSDVDAALTREELHTLPLWLVGSGRERVRIATQALAAGNRDPYAVLHAAHGALAEQRFAEAADLYREVLSSSPRFAQLRALECYARGRAEDLDGARRVQAEARFNGELEHADWPWLAERFGLQ